MLGLHKFGLEKLAFWANGQQPGEASKGASSASEGERQRSPARPAHIESDPELRLRRGLRRLGELRSLLGDCDCLRFADLEVRGLSDDSRRVQPGDLFFAVPGLAHDGAQYAEDAVARGASAIVSCRPLPVPVPVLLVPDVRRAASVAAAAFYRHPSSRFPVIGITGTNGKTSTTELISLCMEDSLGPTGALGTVRYRLGPALPGEEDECPSGEFTLPATNTTPGPLQMQELLGQMRRRAVRGAVLEVSSHALDQGRVEAVQFAAAVLTNITQDHLDYHGDMQNYAAAKARLFAQLRPGAVAVLPYDDEISLRMLEVLAPGVRVIGYGTRSLQSSPLAEHLREHVRAEVLGSEAGKTRVRFDLPEGCTEITLPLIGEHNVRNALAALACAIGLGIGALHASDSLSRARPVDGRLELIGAERLPFQVFVDYAHTPDALEHVLRTCQGLGQGSLRVAFGCGGDRDRKKRAQMGAVARRYADHVVLTQDNPRSEDPEAIVQEILGGMKGLHDDDAPSVEICHDRRRAIRHTLASARPGDIVLIAGKGHETGQVVGTRTLPFDDREEVRAWIERS
jgi:UDP-N-acetylmuramoyl-L-alanyl-D-glutamate--2,6-diaminopimelate ligase